MITLTNNLLLSCQKRYLILACVGQTAYLTLAPMLGVITWTEVAVRWECGICVFAVLVVGEWFQWGIPTVCVD